MIDLEGPGPAEWARRVLAETDSGREAARAFFYGLERGVAGRDGRFDRPTCGNWECISPEHQSWVAASQPHKSPGPSGSRASGQKVHA